MDATTLEQLVAFAETASAIGTVALAIAVLFQIRAAREQVAASRETVEEMREGRLEQNRPHIIVDTDHDKPPLVFVVLRNMGSGAAKNISFEFSAPVESPESARETSPVVPVNEQPYFAQGLDFLAPGAEIPCVWGSMITLSPFLRERGLQDGITVTSKYESLEGGSYESEWTLNPLLVAQRVSVGREKGLKEIAEATESIAGILSVPVSKFHGDLRVTTDEERQQRELLLEQMRGFLSERLRASGTGEPPSVRVEKEEIRSIGPNPRTAVNLFERYFGAQWFGDFERADATGDWVAFRLTGVDEY